MIGNFQLFYGRRFFNYSIEKEWIDFMEIVDSLYAN